MKGKAAGGDIREEAWRRKKTSEKDILNAHQIRLSKHHFPLCCKITLLQDAVLTTHLEFPHTRGGIGGEGAGGDQR